jgi:gas vesicle protein
MTNRCLNRNNTVALLAGALVGTGVALLFAPHSGRKTRRDLRRFAKKVGTKAEAATLEVKHTIDNIVGDAEETLSEGLVHSMKWTDGKIVELGRALDTARKSIAGEIKKIRAA